MLLVSFKHGTILSLYESITMTSDDVPGSPVHQLDDDEGGDGGQEVEQGGDSSVIIIIKTIIMIEDLPVGVVRLADG